MVQVQRETFPILIFIHQIYGAYCCCGFFPLYLLVIALWLFPSSSISKCIVPMTCDYILVWRMLIAIQFIPMKTSRIFSIEFFLRCEVTWQRKNKDKHLCSVSCIIRKRTHFNYTHFNYTCSIQECIIGRL